MKNPKIFDDTKTHVAVWQQEIAAGEIYDIDDASVQQAIRILEDLHPADSDQMLLYLCALNLLNAAVKQPRYTGSMPRSVIKDYASALVSKVDDLRDPQIKYYYDSDGEYLYIQIHGMVFGYHDVPKNLSILKASQSVPIKWPGVKLQTMAQPLFRHVASNVQVDMVQKETEAAASAHQSEHVMEGAGRTRPDILAGCAIGDTVEITLYGVVRQGRITSFCSDFLELETAERRWVRIRYAAVSSVEPVEVQLPEAEDYSFAIPQFKEILDNNVGGRTLIPTNATITMMENRRVWAKTDDGGVLTACFNQNIVGYTPERIVKGQRVYVTPPREGRSFCMLIEMTYDDLFEWFVHEASDLSRPADIRKILLQTVLAFVAQQEIKDPAVHEQIKRLKRRIRTNDKPETESEDPTAGIMVVDNQPQAQPTEAKQEAAPKPSLEKKADEVLPETKTEATEIYEPHKPGVTVVGYVDLSKIKTRNKTKAVTETDLSDQDPDRLPSMGRVSKYFPKQYGFIQAPALDSRDIYFTDKEILSVPGDLDEPKVNDEVVFTLAYDNGRPQARCVHRRCTIDQLQNLIDREKDPERLQILRQRRDEFIQADIPTGKTQVSAPLPMEYRMWLETVGASPTATPEEVEKIFQAKLTPDQYSKAIMTLLYYVIEHEKHRGYPQFLRAISYASTQKMFDFAETLIDLAMITFDKNKDKDKKKWQYFADWNGRICELKNRIPITLESLAESIDRMQHRHAIPEYVRATLLENINDFTGVKLDNNSISMRLYKREYIDELEDNLKTLREQEKRDKNEKETGAIIDDMMYLTLIKLRLSFDSSTYNPNEDMRNFLFYRARKIVMQDNTRYAEACYLISLALKVLQPVRKDLDYASAKLGLLTLGNYTPSGINLYMDGIRPGFTLSDLLRNAVSDPSNSTVLGLSILADADPMMRERIEKAYLEVGAVPASLMDFPAHYAEIQERYRQFVDNPIKGFQSFAAFLKGKPVLTATEEEIFNIDAPKLVSSLTDFSYGELYSKLRPAYLSAVRIIQDMINKVRQNLTKIGYEVLLPALQTLESRINQQFSSVEIRLDPKINLEIIDETVDVQENNAANINVLIRNSSASARDIKILSLHVTGPDLTRDNDLLSIEHTLMAGEEFTVPMELCFKADCVSEGVALGEFMIEYEDIYEFTGEHRLKQVALNGRIMFKKEAFSEIENVYSIAAGGAELGGDDKMFYGREVILDEIKSGILGSYNSQIAVYGQKRSGKSSVLNRIKKWCEEPEQDVVCGKMSLQGVSQQESRSMEYSILLEVAECLASHDLLMDHIEADPTDFFEKEADPFKALAAYIEHVRQHEVMDGKHLVIMIDEFTYLYQLTKEGKVGTDFMRRWKALVETPGINLQSVMAAQDTLPDFMNEGYAANAFGIFSLKLLSYLSREEALQLITEPIEKLHFHNHSYENIYEYTAGSPFFTQKLCKRLVDHLNYKKTCTVTKEEIDSVVRLLCSGTERLEDTIFECLETEADGTGDAEKKKIMATENRMVLKAIAEVTRAGGTCRPDEIRIGLDPDHLLSVLEHLRTRRVISKSEDGGYSINVKLYQKWILSR